MNDPRIAEYLNAIESMKDGILSLSRAVGEEDEIGELGKALTELSHVWSRRFTETDRLLEITERINAGIVLGEVLDYVYDSFRSIVISTGKRSIAQTSANYVLMIGLLISNQSTKKNPQFQECVCAKTAVAVFTPRPGHVLRWRATFTGFPEQ